jgi:hypothetical protein
LPLPPALDNHDLGLRREVARIPRPLPHAQVSAAAVATSQTVVDEAGRHDATLQTPPDKNGAASLWYPTFCLPVLYSGSESFGLR